MIFHLNIQKTKSYNDKKLGIKVEISESDSNKKPDLL